MPDIYIDISEKIAQVRGNPSIVCGNSDYTAHFLFDSEWDAYTTKTARFLRYQDGIPVYTDTLFSGDSVPIPVLSATHELAVGVYAGDIRTTTPARIPCSRCITDSAPSHENPDADVYVQLLAYLASLKPQAPAVGCASAAVSGVTESTAGTADFEEV